MTDETPPQQIPEAPLSFRPLLQQFPPNRGLFLCDDTDGRLISRASSAPLPGDTQETSPTPGLMAPGAYSQTLRPSRLIH